MIQINLGNVLRFLGERIADAGPVRNAVAVFEAVELVEAAHSRAVARLNKGIALVALGRLTNEPAYFDLALNAFDEGAKEFDRSGEPLLSS